MFSIDQPAAGGPDPLPALLLNDRDDVATALRALAPGETIRVGGHRVIVRDAIANGHKIAVRDVDAGAAVCKFGWPIGKALQGIKAGDHVHSHNLATMLQGHEGYEYRPAADAAPLQTTDHVFHGYRRPDGKVGTRNEIWVIPTVGCVARTAEKIANAADLRYRTMVDGVHAFAHPVGCSQLGDDLQGTAALLASLACHPNAGGVLIVGLGCESNQIEPLLARIPENLRGKVATLVAQNVSDEIEEGLAKVDALAKAAAAAKRDQCSLSELVIGVKCGGSDGFSGLTANPLVGRMADAVTGAGGSAIVTEIPEIFGAERLLMARAANAEIFGSIVELVNDFKGYFLAHGEPVSENPSPGNIAGGITTLEEKSLGAVQKAGHAPVVDVIRYGERIAARGLTLLEAPGNDAISSTALAAAGATLILFTTGRGTPLGFPVPTIKIASNSELAKRKSGWIDFDAGPVLEEGLNMMEARLLQTLIAAASGERTAAERNGEREIAIWKRGVTL